MLAETELAQLALGKLDELAPSAQRVAVCLYGPSVYARPKSFRGHDVLAICEEYAPGLRTHPRTIDKDEARFLLVERDLVESDIRNGTLGDFLTEKFLYPYRPIANDDYLGKLGLSAQARVVREEVKDLVLEYGEMCRGLAAKPEFFGLSRMRKRARALVPSLEDYLRFLDPAVRERNISILRGSFKKAIASLPDELVELEGDDVTILDNAVDRWIKDRASNQVVNILTQSQRAFYSYLTKSRSIYLSPDLVVRELYGPLRLRLDPGLVGREPEDPKNYLCLRTAEGLVSLNEKASLEDVISKLRPGRPVTISPLAGVLNEVYLVTSGKDRFVAKRFTDWHGFKWFTLNFVSFGSKFFALSGKTRMTNEYGINRYLAKRGMKVPQVIHANVKQRLLVENYIAGMPVNRFVTEAVSQGALTKSQHRVGESLGETLATIHEFGVSVGDSKPENFVVKDGEIFTVDLEQAGKRGDRAWDIAELLFYTGHYSPSTTPTKALSELVEAFVRGYLTRGEIGELKRAAGVRYTKVFSFWTPAPILMEIVKTLRAAS
jgi:tRNA A-37 threonylcarbamoyl transferase component Bud32